MHSNIVDLRDFYQSSLGRVARRLLCARVKTVWPHVTAEKVAVIGYGPPLLRPWLDQAQALYALMPAAQGIAYWPREGPNLSCLVDLDALPLPDASVDRIVLLHALEGMAEPAPLLREVWRVLKSNGRLLTIAPNRHGLWAHSDRTPFGNGQPYSLFQIKQALHQQGFLTERHLSALYALPSSSRLGLRLADRVEKMMAWLCPHFGGVLMVESSKQLYAPRPQKNYWQNRLVFPLPLSAPTPFPTGYRAES